MTSKSNFTFPGIYTITCVPTSRVYVGKATKLQRRWTRHIRDMRVGEHHNEHLSRAWKKYGADAFVFAVAADLSHVPADQLDDALSDAECEVLKLHPKNFNLTQAGPGGMRATPELSAKLSAERTARWADPEYRARVIASMKIAAADQDFQERRGAAISRGMDNAQYKAKRSALTKGLWAAKGFREARSKEREENWKDPEYRDAQHESRKAVWANPEARERRMAGLKASWADPEVKARRQAAMLAGRGKRTPIEVAIFDFLKENRPTGYTGAAVWRAVEARLKTKISRATPRAALNRMMERGEVARDGDLYRAP